MVRAFHVFVLAFAPWCFAAATRPAGITIHVEDATAEAVVGELARQTGAVLPLSPADLLRKQPLARVTVDADGQSFWAVLKSLGRQAQLEPLVSADDAYPRFQLGLGSGAFWEEPHAIAGPVVVFANSVVRATTVDLRRKAEHSVSRDLTLQLTAYVQPGLRVLGASQTVALKEAVDEAGRSLVPAGPPGDPGAVVDYTVGGQHTWNLAVALTCPTGAGKRIAKLRGVTHLRLQTRSELVEIEDVLRVRNVVRAVAGVPVTFRSLKRADGEYVLGVSLRREKKPEVEWQMLHQSVYNGMMSLYDAKGRLVADRATENGGDYGPARIDAALRFVREAGVANPEAGEPHKLVWHAPLAGDDLPIEFELTDLSIPD